MEGQQGHGRIVIHAMSHCCTVPYLPTLRPHPYSNAGMMDRNEEDSEGNTSLLQPNAAVLCHVSFDQSLQA